MTPRLLSVLALLALAASFGARPAAAQDTASLASKSIAHVHAIQNRVFAFAEGGASYSQLDLFGTPQVRTRTWPWNGGAEGAAAWGSSLLVRANYWISDSQRVARATSLRYAGTFRGGDSLIFRDPVDTTLPLADGARLTAVAVRDSAGTATAVLAFGRLGIAYTRLAGESGTATVDPLDSMVVFRAFPATSDTQRTLHTCRWNRLCRIDTLQGAGASSSRDSVIAVALDSAHADTTWLLIATDKGLRRGRFGGTYFPYVALPGIDSAGAAVRAVFAAPGNRLAWAFTGSRFFFSDDHGATWRVPPTLPGIYAPSSLVGYSPRRAPHAAFRGDTTFINFNLDRPGLVMFRRDTILANAGTGLGQVLLDTADGLDISRDESELTTLTVARGAGSTANQAILVAGSTNKGVFHRRVDQTGTAFENLNRLKVLKGGLTEVITYPSIYTGYRMVKQGNNLLQTTDPDVVRIGYRLGGDARVTITVYNYAMEKVREIVRNAPRRGGARSENIAEDVWDGLDASGRRVSVGTYYVLVESDKGDKGFGKVIVTRGRR